MYKFFYQTISEGFGILIGIRYAFNDLPSIGVDEGRLEQQLLDVVVDDVTRCTDAGEPVDKQHFGTI